MRIFDAATPEMRRMRNQKKDRSVLANMLITSESVEQVECVWDEGMSKIDRTRNVYDSPSVDGSPKEIKEQAPPAKKRRGRIAAVPTPQALRKTRSVTKALRSSTRGAKKEKIKSEEHQPSDGDVKDVKTHCGLTVFDDAAHDPAIATDIFASGRQMIPGESQLHDQSQFVAYKNRFTDMADNPFADHPMALPQRSAMQSLPANRPMSSMFGRHNHHTQFALFDKENERNPYAMHRISNLPAFLSQQRQSVQTDGLNPLCVQRQDNLSYLWSGFDASQETNTPFQTMSMMDYSALNSSIANGLNSSMNGGPSYQGGHISGENQEFSV
ncbi:hypothetical protein BD289DRAFT_92277 [Coniella lustricola]|uniref:Uncharacterized protein n=1 Tax=Coniella lustricola TaxID=2025994 RepID=A0A2T3AH55_9PEZI|nr:hypothetical protein BD289DRAFT_92277 [Coniella lustricola]